MFEGDQAKWSLTHLQFYREKGRAKVQFLDPVALTAYARGLETRYQWKLSVTSPRSKVISQGESVGSMEPNGAFKIDLEKTAMQDHQNCPIDKTAGVHNSASALHPVPGVKNARHPAVQSRDIRHHPSLQLRTRAQQN